MTARYPATRRFHPLHAALLVLALILGGCSREQPPLQSRKFLAFGTLVEVDIYGADEKVARRAMDDVEQQFHVMHDAWNPYQAGALARLNTQLASMKWIPVPPSVRPLIVRAAVLAKQSGNLFNPAIGDLIKLWGFYQEPRPDDPPPAAPAVAALVAHHPTIADLELAGNKVRSRNPAVFLDFGAFAKGYGVDRTIEHLKQLGIRNAIINAGGDLRAIGQHGNRPWRIGIRNPRGPGILASVEVEGDQSVFTSGDYERYFIYKGKRYNHIMDPRTGYPAPDTTSVTVIYGNGATADAAATALFVAGPKDWYKVAKAMDIHYVMLVDTSGNVYMNPAMAKRIHFETKKPPKVILSPPL